MSVKCTAGTAESFTYSLRLNNTTDYTITNSATLAAVSQQFSNGTMSIAVVAGDYVELKMACPTWATNPTLVYNSFTIYIE